MPRRDPAQNKRSTQVESEGMEKNIPSKWTCKKAGVAIVISDKINFETKTITRDKESNCVILKIVIQQEDLTFVNTYSPSTGAPQYIRKILEDFEKEIDNNRVIIANFNTTMSMDRSPNKDSMKILWH